MEVRLRRRGTCPNFPARQRSRKLPRLKAPRSLRRRNFSGDMHPNTARKIHLLGGPVPRQERFGASNGGSHHIIRREIILRRRLLAPACSSDEFPQCPLGLRRLIARMHVDAAFDGSGGFATVAKAPDFGRFPPRYEPTHGLRLHLMPGECREGAFRAAVCRNSGLGPVEEHRGGLGGAEAVHGTHDIQQKAAPRPCIFGNGREDVSQPQAVDTERIRRRRRGRLRKRGRRWRGRGWRPGRLGRVRSCHDRCSSWRRRLRLPGIVRRLHRCGLGATHPDIDAEAPVPSMSRTALRHRPHQSSPDYS